MKPPPMWRGWRMLIGCAPRLWRRDSTVLATRRRRRVLTTPPPRRRGRTACAPRLGCRNLPVPTPRKGRRIRTKPRPTGPGWRVLIVCAPRLPQPAPTTPPSCPRRRIVTPRSRLCHRGTASLRHPTSPVGSGPVRLVVRCPRAAAARPRRRRTPVRCRGPVAPSAHSAPPGHRPPLGVPPRSPAPRCPGPPTAAGPGGRAAHPHRPRH